MARCIYLIKLLKNSYITEEYVVIVGDITDYDENDIADQVTHLFPDSLILKMKPVRFLYTCEKVPKWLNKIIF